MNPVTDGNHMLFLLMYFVYSEGSHSGPLRGVANPLSRKARAGSNPAPSAESDSANGKFDLPLVSLAKCSGFDGAWEFRTLHTNPAPSANLLKPW